MLLKRLESGWAILLPCALMSLVALFDLTLLQWRVVIVLALLATVTMLFHQRLRHFLLLPSCIALAGGLAAILMNSHAT